MARARRQPKAAPAAHPALAAAAKKKAEEEAYINPELAEQEKQKGNERYKPETTKIAENHTA